MGTGDETWSWLLYFKVLACQIAAGAGFVGAVAAGRVLLYGTPAHPGWHAGVAIGLGLFVLVQFGIGLVLSARESARVEHKAASTCPPNCYHCGHHDDFWFWLWVFDRSDPVVVAPSDPKDGDGALLLLIVLLLGAAVIAVFLTSALIVTEMLVRRNERAFLAAHAAPAVKPARCRE